MRTTDIMMRAVSIRTLRRSAGIPRLGIRSLNLPDTFAQTQLATFLTGVFPNVQVESPQAEFHKFITLIEFFKSVRESERRKFQVQLLTEYKIERIGAEVL
ncbi:hypothetical protein QCA50_010978 [Cerrena zonata]|uniref:Uncharacterized protein n=1 Tax=Cerrena zonata TaxID=2478898 RepID=A0AAW0G1S1_9APHY